MRDGYHCAMTGRYNATSVENGVPVAGNVLAMSEAQVAHIFPPSTNLGTGEQEGDKVRSIMYLLVDLQFISLACSVTMRRGCGTFREGQRFLKLNGPDIHRLENIMTSDLRVHGLSTALTVTIYPNGRMGLFE